MKLQEELRVARVRKNLSQQALANILGITQQLVSEWERGEEQVATRHWDKLKSEVGLDVAIFMENEDAALTHTSIQIDTSKSIETIANSINSIHMDEKGMSICSYGDNAPVPGIDADDWQELLYWLRRHPTLIKPILRKAKEKGLIMDQVVNDE